MLSKRKIVTSLYPFFLQRLLVAPVHKKRTTTQKVFLTEGKWIKYCNGEHVKGNTEQIFSTPIDQMLLFVKQRYIIPMHNYSSSVEKGNNNLLTLHNYVGADGSFNFPEDDGTSNDYLKNIYASTIMELKNSSNKFTIKIYPLKSSYKGMSISRKWILNIHYSEIPKQIKMNRQNLKFNYNKVTKTAIVETSQQSFKQGLNFEVNYKLNRC